MKLKYPKNLGITKTELMKEKTKFKYPKAWEIKEDKKNYYLEFNKNMMDKIYLIKRA